MIDTIKEMEKLSDSLKVKVCTKCKKTKYGNEISLSQSWCKQCKKEYRENNKKK